MDIKLPDGSIKRFDQPVSVADVAASIGPGLAKAAIAGKVDGKVVDTSHVIDRDASVAIPGVSGQICQLVVRPRITHEGLGVGPKCQQVQLAQAIAGNGAPRRRAQVAAAIAAQLGACLGAGRQA